MPRFLSLSRPHTPGQRQHARGRSNGFSDGQHRSGIWFVPCRGALLSLATAAALAGCSVLPTKPYERPALSVPDKWQQYDTVSQRDKASSVEDAAWWSHFGDAQLMSLIERARLHNHDAVAAKLNLDKAQALSGGASAALWPTASLNVSRHLHDTAAGAQGAQNMTFSLEQEWDLWGRRAGEKAAAEAQSRATAYDRAQVLQRVVRETASMYWKVAALEQRRELTLAALDDSRAEGARAKARYTAGVVSADVPAQADQEYARVQSDLAAIEFECAAARSALAILLGDAPGTTAGRTAGTTAGITADILSELVPALPDVSKLPDIAVGIPADVLARRPDLQASEWLLRASYANAGVARASLYPRITLTGQLGTRSSDLIDFISRPLSSVVATIGMPILRWHQLRFDVKIADTNQALAQNTFAKNVHHALKEVEDGLAQRARFERQYKAGSEVLSAATRIEEMMAIRYHAGEADASSWYRQRADRRHAALAQTEIHYLQLVNAIKLYQALGGGASLPEAVAASLPEDVPASLPEDGTASLPSDATAALPEVVTLLS